MFSFLAVFQTVKAVDGDLDPAFGNGGKLITFVADSESYARAVAVQPDGKIITVGQSGISSTVHSALLRYNNDGSLDQTFGSGGIVVAALSSSAEVLNSLVLQPDGKIVAAGSLVNNSFNLKVVVARFNPNGDLDQTFGSGGKVIFNYGDSNSESNDVVLQSDGKIIVVGMSGAGTSSELNDYAIARLNSDGSFDSNYGNGGQLKTHFEGTTNTGSKANSAVLQPDGKLLVAGNYKTDGSTRQFALARYNTDGNLDLTFGDGGKITTILGTAEAFANSVALQTDGKIVLAGSFLSAHRNSDFALARYNADGTLDTTFGSGGKIITDLFGETDDKGYSLFIQPDGKLVVGGRTGTHLSFKFALARYDSSGSFDQSFGNGGKVVTEISPVREESFSAVLQPDGKIILAGYAITGNSIDGFRLGFALSRYLATASRSTQFDFDGDGRADISVFRSGMWYVNRSTAGQLTSQFGLNTDKIIPGDYDGDGKTDIAVFRPSDGNWYILNSGSSSFSSFNFGLEGDIPVCGDFDSDRRADIAVYRNGIWYIQSSTAGFWAVQFGLSTDKTVPADYDGDGKTDIAVFRDGVWYIQKSTGGYLFIRFGLASDIPVTADYDGDGISDIAVWRATEGVWYIRQSSNNAMRAFQWGTSGDMPVPADYDGDGKADFAIFRNGSWWIWQTSTGDYRQMQFGSLNDVPVPAAFVR